MVSVGEPADGSFLSSGGLSPQRRVSFESMRLLGGRRVSQPHVNHTFVALAGLE
jgi:hypothetical protein